MSALNPQALYFHPPHTCKSNPQGNWLLGNGQDQVLVSGLNSCNRQKAQMGGVEATVEEQSELEAALEGDEVAVPAAA